MSCEINDVREQKDFKQTSFSGYKKTDVCKELLSSFLNSKIESACYWSSELICSGHYQDLWHIIIHIMSKYIHLGNPKLPTYIEMRINNFKDIVAGGYVDRELRMRNNSQIRAMFAEVMCILCNSQRKHSFETIKIKKEEEFDITRMTEKFKAPNTSFAKDVYKNGDPKELFIAINELAYHLSPSSNNTIQCCYWVEWILEFETQCKKKKVKCKCERREFIPVSSKDQMDIVWVIWDLLLTLSKQKSSIIQRNIQSLLNIFTLRYTSGVVRRRKFIIYFVISYLTENMNPNIALFRDRATIEGIKTKIDTIYKQIKKNEHTPNTDYLFNNNISRSNLDKTIEKLEIMKTINF